MAEWVETDKYKKVLLRLECLIQNQKHKSKKNWILITKKKVKKSYFQKVYSTSCPIILMKIDWKCQSFPTKKKKLFGKQ